MFIMETKTCSRCCETKPISDYYESKGTRSARCKECFREVTRQRRAADPERTRQMNREYRRKNPGKARVWDVSKRLKATRNMTLDEYNALLQAQEGRCAICLSPEPGFKKGRFAVDHDHSCCPSVKSCGRCTRGLLCHNCNLTLGRMRDNPAAIQRMLDYVQGRPMFSATAPQTPAIEAPVAKEIEGPASSQP